MINITFLAITKALAQGTTCPTTEFQTTFGCVTKQNSVGYFISLIITKALPFAVSLSILMIIYAGILYITSSGEQEKISTAKDIVVTTIIGLALLLLIKFIAGNIIGIPEAQ